MAKNIKQGKKLERYFKGAANHWRLEVLILLEKHPSLTLEEIIKKLNANEKTISGHTQRLLTAGLLDKKYKGRSVEHTLSPYGKLFVTFLKKFTKEK
ncbi:MAG: winged helix-turn-helix domain-containing protein [Candidatus Paceibacterota bacterium]